MAASPGSEPTSASSASRGANGSSHTAFRDGHKGRSLWTRPKAVMHAIISVGRPKQAFGLLCQPVPPSTAPDASTLPSPRPRRHCTHPVEITNTVLPSSRQLSLQLLAEDRTECHMTSSRSQGPLPLASSTADRGALSHPPAVTPTQMLLSWVPRYENVRASP